MCFCVCDTEKEGIQTFKNASFLSKMGFHFFLYTPLYSLHWGEGRGKRKGMIFELIIFTSIF